VNNENKVIRRDRDYLVFILGISPQGEQRRFPGPGKRPMAANKLFPNPYRTVRLGRQKKPFQGYTEFSEFSQVLLEFFRDYLYNSIVINDNPVLKEGGYEKVPGSSSLNAFSYSCRRNG
jgi:hypothetical protein